MAARATDWDDAAAAAAECAPARGDAGACVWALAQCVHWLLWPVEACVVVSELTDWMTPIPHQQMSTSFSCYTISIRQSKANQTNKWRSLVSRLSHYSWNRWFNKLLCAVLADTSLTQAVECVYNKIKITLKGTCNYISHFTSFTIKLSWSSLKRVQPAAGRISVVVSSPCQGDSFSCKTNERGYRGNGHRYRFGKSCVYC